MCNDNSQIKVSVLIPVYGVEKYIERCARSLFEQTMREGIEFIFTDDCTPDNSIAIIEKVLNDYPERKHQVRIIHHETNKGLAIARVTGVNAARGEYVIHCDSDDWVEPNMYDLMYAKAKGTDADIVGCDFYEETGKKKIPIKQNFNLDSKQSVLEILLGRRILDSYLWCRLIKKSFYLKHKFAAPAGVSLLEDMAVSIPIHSMTQKVSKVDLPLYHYSKVSGGITQTITKDKVLSALLALEFIRPYCNGDISTVTAYYNRYCRMAQPLITQKEIYNPQLWRRETLSIPLSCFGTLKHRISPFLVKHHLDTLNLFLIKLYRR